MNSGLNHRVTGAGPAVILLHPVGLDLGTWDPVADALAPSHTVVSLDLPGFGASPQLPRGAVVSDYAHAVVTLMDEIGIAKASLVGASFGGMIAQTIALENPDRVSALIPSACPAGIDREVAPVILKRGTDAEAHGMEAVVDETLKRWFTPAFLLGEGGPRFREKLLADNIAGWYGAWYAISHFDIRPRLKEIAAPTLCIAGRVDLSAPVPAMQVVAAGIPGARIEIVEGAPHMIHIEQPRRFADLIGGFLAENDGS